MDFFTRVCAFHPEIIETYWNVNTVNSVKREDGVSGNNRNILECKCALSSWTFCIASEIIETYWNVNEKWGSLQWDVAEK